MELINATRLMAGYTMGMEPSGRELLVVVVKGTFVVVKGTFRIPDGREPIRLDDEQVPLVTSDVFFGEPGRSAPRYEADFAPRKRRCDVLLNASACARDGRPTTSTRVGVRIGEWSKAFTVVGDRVWEAGPGGIAASPPVPYLQMPINYDRAFGGIDDRSQDPSQHAAFMKNPSGRGFHRHLRHEWVDGSPLPNTEEDGKPIMSPDGDYQPMSFGPIGRHWEPRSRYAGTYDERWLEDHAPFLPPDFDEQYYQAAPLDQQIPFPEGEAEVVLVNLTGTGRTAFVLPVFEAPFHFFPKRGGREDGTLALDTVVLEPNLRRFTLTWRAARPLKKNMFEVAQVMVGKRSQAWWAKRESVEFPVPSSAEPGAEEADGRNEPQAS
jgi:hypothetical protein